MRRQRKAKILATLGPASSSREQIDALVRVGGKLSDRKGVNVPDVVLALSPLTTKDRADLRFGIDLGCDWVAMSFVQRPEGTVNLSEAVMVARGDLGAETPPEDVPALQKRFIAACRKAGKPVIVA